MTVGHSGAARPSRGARSARGHADSPLTWLHARRDRDGRRFIDARQLEAGERFEADFRHARIGPRMTSSWSVAPSGQGGARAAPGFGVDLADSVVAARQRVTAALDALGPELDGIVLDVCGLQIGVEEAERRRGWPPRSGKVVLALALSRLARHYGLGPARPDGGGPGDIGHWAAVDARPTLDQWR